MQTYIDCDAKKSTKISIVICNTKYDKININKHLFIMKAGWLPFINKPRNFTVYSLLWNKLFGNLVVSFLVGLIASVRRRFLSEKKGTEGTL